VSLVDYWSVFGDTVIDLLISHIILFVIALAGAAIIGIGLGVLLFEFRGAAVAVPVVNVLQATPELVLLALSIPFLGIGYVGAIVPLFVKGVLPVMRNTLGGLESVDPELTEAARGMGMSDRQVLLRVQMVAAMPVIIAGLRVSAVMLVSVITLTAYIGVESLGTIILQGISRMDRSPLLIGSGLAALLAILVNQAMLLAERVAARTSGVGQ
jgi:osmoprotectant transport system permease protein